MSGKRKSGRKPYGSSKDERATIALIILKRRKRKGYNKQTPYYTIAYELNNEGYRTRDGKLWRAQQVRKILSKAENLPFADKHPKKTQLNRSDYLTKQQVADCRAVFKDDHEKIIFETLLGSALRASELCGLQIGDLSLDAEPYEIEVRRGKGCKQRSAIIGPKLAGLLREHIRKREGGQKRPLLLNRRYERVKYRDVYYAIRQIGKRAHIPTLHPHTLRHTWATLCDYETACFDIANQLGHSNLSTTAIYRKVRIQQRMRTAVKVEKQLEAGIETENMLENIAERAEMA